MAKGQKTGGRNRGTPNKATAQRERVLSEGGMMPLGYMLKVLRSEESTADEKKWAAEKAAPYCHPRLTNIDLRAYAELNANVTQTQVIDVSGLEPAARRQLRQLLLQAMASQSEPEEIEGEFSVSEGEG